MVFVDEAGINLGMARRYGWSARGERLVAPSPFCRGNNVSLLGALSTEGMVTELMIHGPVDEQVFLVFLNDYLIPQLTTDHVVIMDNLSFHKGTEVKKAFAAAGITLLYLPPYSPELDPMENAWSKIKESLRAAAARTYETLADSVRYAVMSITDKDALGWFAHCGYEEPCNKPT